MARTTADRQFVVCVKNRGYRASLVLRRIYELVPDSEASEHGLSRVIDESGDDYLYPSCFFMAIELPQPVKRAIAGAR
jgi:hypothetical protein